MAINIEPASVLLTVDEDGTVRVGGTRVILDLVVRAFKRSLSPEEIVAAYGVLRLADVYAVVAYYLDHQAEIDDHLAAREREGQELRRYFEVRIPKEVRQRVRAHRARRQAE